MDYELKHFSETCLEKQFEIGRAAIPYIDIVFWGFSKNMDGLILNMGLR